MKTILVFAFVLSFLNCLSQTIKTANPKKDTIIYRELKCGLYISANGDIAYKTEALINEEGDKTTRYASWIWGANQEDTVGNGGIMEMKDVVDTATFKFLTELYWVDKNNVYGLTPMSDGGNVFLIEAADSKTLKIFGTSDYAADRKNIYYRGNIVQGADRKTFKPVENIKKQELAWDKNNFYLMGKRISAEEFKMKSND